MNANEALDGIAELKNELTRRFEAALASLQAAEQQGTRLRTIAGSVRENEAAAILKGAANPLSSLAEFAGVCVDQIRGLQ